MRPDFRRRVHKYGGTCWVGALAFENALLVEWDEVTNSNTESTQNRKTVWLSFHSSVERPEVINIPSFVFEYKRKTFPRHTHACMHACTVFLICRVLTVDRFQEK